MDAALLREIDVALRRALRRRTLTPFMRSQLEWALAELLETEVW